MKVRISHERLTEVLDYKSESGYFINRVQRGSRSRPGEIAGSVAVKKCGSYIRIRIDNTDYDAGVLAFFYMTKRYPALRIDHVDGNGLNNTWGNLREATVWQNRANSMVGSVSTHGHRGVRFIQGRKKPWHARLYWEGKLYSLGYHVTCEEALVAHDNKALELWGTFSPSWLIEQIALRDTPAEGDADVD